MDKYIHIYIYLEGVYIYIVYVCVVYVYLGMPAQQLEDCWGEYQVAEDLWEILSK